MLSRTMLVAAALLLAGCQARPLYQDLDRDGEHAVPWQQSPIRPQTAVSAWKREIG